jgi:hypothetical protein
MLGSTRTHKTDPRAGVLDQPRRRFGGPQEPVLRLHPAWTLRTGVHGGFAVALLAVAALTGASAAVVVSPSNMAGWTASHSTCGAAGTGSQAFVLGPPLPPAGTGSRQFMVGENGDSFETFRTAVLNGTPLSDITALSYSTYTETTGGQVVYLNLLVSTDGDGVADNQMFFEPLYQSGYNASLPDQGPVVPNMWQSWDALAGGWWDLNGFAGPGTDVRSFEDFVAAFPDATVANSDTGLGGVRLAAGCGHPAWAGFVGYADNVTLGGAMGATTYDFELLGPLPTSPAPTTPAPTTPTSPVPTTPVPTTSPPSTSTPAIPFFPTAAAFGVAIMGAVLAGVLILRRRK